jgi:CheY-like chemotaxis protein
VRRAELLSAIQKALGGHSGNGAAPPERPTTRHGLRILIVEDNRINQMVATRIIARMGHTVEIAENGQIAVEMFGAKAWDVVLMDLQMPEMDGFTATGLIRQMETQRHVRTPILAVTAHAMQGDRERCLAAGMDGFVSKPLTAKELAAAIRRLVPDAPDETSPVANRAPDEAISAAWDVETTLSRLEGDRELLAEIVGIFLREAPRQLAALRQAIEQGNAEAVTEVAHSLKGQLGYLGIPGAAEQARRLEDLGREGLLSEVGAEYEILARRMDAAMRSMRNAEVEN